MHSGFGALRSQMPMQCNRQPAERHWDEAAQRDIDRVQQLWRELRQSHGDGEGFLCGAFGIVDAMFAPVCVRFRGYGPALDRNAQRYLDTISPCRRCAPGSRTPPRKPRPPPDR
jgi:glutathione S-transferase